MKKSIWALMYAVLFTSYPVLMYMSFGLTRTNLIELEQVGYEGQVNAIITAIALNIVLSVIGSIMSWKGYNKNKPNLILFATILMGVVVLLSSVIPILTVLPILMMLLGIISFQDVKKIIKIKPEP